MSFRVMSLVAMTVLIPLGMAGCTSTGAPEGQRSTDEEPETPDFCEDTFTQPADGCVWDCSFDTPCDPDCVAEPGPCQRVCDPIGSDNCQWDCPTPADCQPCQGPGNCQLRCPEANCQTSNITCSDRGECQIACPPDACVEHAEEDCPECGIICPREPCTTDCGLSRCARLVSGCAPSSPLQCALDRSLPNADPACAWQQLTNTDETAACAPAGGEAGSTYQVPAIASPGRMCDVIGSTSVWIPVCIPPEAPTYACETPADAAPTCEKTWDCQLSCPPEACEIVCDPPVSLGGTPESFEAPTGCRYACDASACNRTGCAEGVIVPAPAPEPEPGGGESPLPVPASAPEEGG